MAEDLEYYEITRQNLLRQLSEQSALHIPDEVRDLRIDNVLDIGCGIGQALYPLVTKKGALGVGIDISSNCLKVGREFYEENAADARIAFVRSSAESLPFASESFDVVNCGLALPYTDNPRALSEIQRVLKPGGILLLKIHHLRYYLRKMQQGLVEANLLSVIHCGRVFITGAIYHLSGRQPMTRILNETFQTRWRLKSELTKCGMFIEREHLDANPAAPAFTIRKHNATRA